jgi:ABC-type Fe3+ transport system substrate-binding protein
LRFPLVAETIAGHMATTANTRPSAGPAARSWAGYLLALACAGAVAFAAGCGGEQGSSRNERATGDVEAQIVRKWHKRLDALPARKLVLISPHNESIASEFGWAFVVHYALAHGKRVNLEWRDVGGGSTGIVRYLRNVYDHSDTAEIDIVWGGGQVEFQKLAGEGLLEPINFAPDALANIPATFGGLEMRDPNNLWCGSAISGVGFLYNRQLLDRSGAKPPANWDDLAGPGCFDLICLADPMQSGSAALVYVMIVQSEPTWPQGWAKLLGVLGNAKRFVDSAGAAANAPAMGEAPIAACIDFYGTTRVAEAPDMLVYVSPKGQTAFSPDPIAILKNPPSPELAQAFVDFVLSKEGQALWALKVGDPEGPVRNALGRQPIRTDVYGIYAGRFSPWTINPYDSGSGMTLDTKMLNESFGPMRNLVRAAAIDNLPYLQAARKKLIETNFAPAMLTEFNRLPDNVATSQAVADMDKKLRDKTQAEKITSQWQQFFRDKYRKIVSGER